MYVILDNNELVRNTITLNGGSGHEFVTVIRFVTVDIATGGFYKVNNNLE